MGVHHQSEEGPLFAPSNPFSVVGGGNFFFIHGQTMPLQLPQTPGRGNPRDPTHTHTLDEIELNFPLDCSEK